MPKRDGVDYWVDAKQRYRMPKPYCRKIYQADRLQALVVSDLYKTEARELRTRFRTDASDRVEATSTLSDRR